MSALTSTVRSDFLSALLAGDGTRARHVVDRALEGGMDVLDVYFSVLGPALADVGDLWERGEVAIAYEHFATSVTQSILGALAPRIRVAPHGGRLAVLACGPGETHAVGVQMTGDLLEGAGWEVLQLGASVPAADLAQLVADEQPDVVGLSIATVAMIPGIRETLARLDEVTPRPFVVLGGRAWDDVAPEDVAALGADAQVSDPREFLALVVERFPPLDEDPVV